MVAPTRFGLKALAFLAMLVAAFFVSPYSNLFFLQLGFYCVLLVASMFWVARNLAGVSGECVEPRPFATLADSGTLHAALRKRRGVARAVGLTVRLNDGTTIRLADRFEVDSRCDRSVEGRLPRLPRGVHEIRSVTATSAYPLGLWRASRAIAAPREFVVFPAPVDELRLRGRGVGSVLAALGGAVGEPSDDSIANLREWREGDQPQRIHWRATARRGKWIVKEPELESGDALCVVLDRRIADPAVFERALAELVTLTLAARESAESLQLVSQGITASFGDRGEPLDRLLRWTALADRLPSDAPSPPIAPAGAFRLPLVDSRAALPRAAAVLATS
ncbi:MAG: DUF58 domain-containing protein [Planctomycetota bacterium]